MTYDQINAQNKVLHYQYHIEHKFEIGNCSIELIASGESINIVWVVGCRKRRGFWLITTICEG